MLGGHIGRNVGVADQARGRSDIDHPAAVARDHVGHDFPGHQKSSGDVHRQSFVPGGQIGLDKRRARRLAGIVDQDIDGTERAARRRDAGADLGFIGDVEISQHLRRRMSQRGPYCRERLAAAAREAHARAGFGTGSRNRGADARPRAGDEDVLILERLVCHDDAILTQATARRRHAPGWFRTATWRRDIASARRSISSRSWPPRAGSRRGRRDADGRSRTDRRDRRR